MQTTTQDFRFASPVPAHTADTRPGGAPTVGLVVIGIAATRWPARRASSINPIKALRTE